MNLTLHELNVLINTLSGSLGIADRVNLFGFMHEHRTELLLSLMDRMNHVWIADISPEKMSAVTQEE